MYISTNTNNREQKVLYKTSQWLNEDATSSTGSIVCCHTVYTDEKEQYESIFTEIADCHVKARLHKSQYESKQQFINKLELLQEEIEKFIRYLKK